MREPDERLNFPRLQQADVEAIAPNRCLQYLEEHGWYQDDVIEEGEIVLYRHPDHVDYVLRLPLTRKYDDYASVVAFAITTSAAQEHRPYWEVYMDMSGRYYVGPHTYSTTPQLNGSANGTTKRAEHEPAEIT